MKKTNKKLVGGLLIGMIITAIGGQSLQPHKQTQQLTKQHHQSRLRKDMDSDRLHLI